MSDDLLNTPGYTPSGAMSDKTEKCNERAESFIPREGKSYACVLPKGHEGEHHGGGNCFKHGDYVGLRGCPICFPDGAQVSFGNTSGKTEVRAACESAAKEIEKECYKFVPSQTLTSSFATSLCADIIEHHIAPLLRSARIAAIEECAKSVGSFPLSVEEENRGRLVNRLRALKERP